VDYLQSQPDPVILISRGLLSSRRCGIFENSTSLFFQRYPMLCVSERQSRQRHHRCVVLHQDSLDIDRVDGVSFKEIAVVAVHRAHAMRKRKGYRVWPTAPAPRRGGRQRHCYGVTGPAGQEAP